MRRSQASGRRASEDRVVASRPGRTVPTGSRRTAGPREGSLEIRREERAKETAMTIATQKIRPCLWFDTEAEEAAKFYVSIFKNSRIGTVNRYSNEGREVHGKPAGSVMAVEFELEGQKFVGLNGGPQFKFDEAISFQIHCETQEEIDYYWSRLTEGGKEVACGWLKDKFGLSWQVVPTLLLEMLADKDQDKVDRVTKAFLKMKKFDIEQLKRAFEGRA
jgi:predicted 3-demethylubiquinone-9 3-methyltransferase (glyoxalase superfamily)